MVYNYGNNYTRGANNLKIAICDDEQIICEHIKSQLISINPDYNIMIFNSGEQLLTIEKKIDLILLDIEMEGLTGMETANLLRRRKNNELIIFLTSHAEYMSDAFKVRAFRFLNKPIKLEKFNEAIYEAEKAISNRVKVSVNRNGKSQFINIQDVIYFEANGDGTYIYTKYDVLTSNRQLKEWLDKLGNTHFFQIHRSYIVALRYVNKINKHDAEMNYSKSTVPISRRNYVKLKNVYFACF